MKLTLTNFIAFAFLIITVPSVMLWLTIRMNGVFIWWIVEVALLLAFIKAKKITYNLKDNNHNFFLLAYLTWNIICIIRGIFVAANYWEWKNLITTGLVLLLPLTYYAFTSPLIIQRLLKVWFKFGLPLFFLFVPFFSEGVALGRYLAPVGLILLFIGFLSKKWKIIVLLFSFLVILGALDARSNVIKFSVALIFGSLFYAKNIIPLGLFKITRFLFLFLPFVLLVLGLTGKFNVFKMDDYVDGDVTANVNRSGKSEQEDLKADTRTGLYEEVLSSAKKHNYIIEGRTPARGNDSELFGEILANELKTGKMERFSNEVSVLNVFTWTGLIGVTLYFLVFFKASALAIGKSNSITMRIVGIYVAFRWCYGWVEDFSDFDLSYIILWMLICMCFSNAFREMTDKDFFLWTRNVFYKNLPIKKK